MLVAVRRQDGKRIPQQMRWGLVPWWAKDIKVGFSSINAPAETVDTTRAFRDAWKKGQRHHRRLLRVEEAREATNTPLPWRQEPHGDGRPVGRVD